MTDGDTFLVHANQCDSGTVWARPTWYKSGRGWHFAAMGLSEPE
ncbi:hypothetical protein ABZT34_08985 [Streptomyces sp. NPDC005329]